MSSSKKRIVVIGATSLIAEHCLRLWLKEGPADVVLVGRNQTKTMQVASDLRVRSPESSIDCLEGNFIDPGKIGALIDAVAGKTPVDIALVAHGSLPDQQECQEKLDACNEALVVNGLSPVLFAEALAGHMQKANAGTLAIVGSVAGDRGRKSNYVYGSAKGLVTRYVQGLQHRLAGTGVKVVLIKPGPTDTPMTAHMAQQGAKLASVESVSAQIVKAVKQGQPLVYAPAKWALIMMIIRHLPRFIFNKMNI